ncbi:hypothetical protein Rumeso_01328 [Rubellimicrobium mesophilum DSM 19309]|uniref:DUF6314 domain-containing protein n=1 Tax=Rubellimicrobium mesophilum DSM 19309 TaxID=442562 RepID=A0A017HTM5_9RHOB|nr:DUF6314 family protein [Rubellimicrobium mesophilum]EYD77069.1 hypothetical protein Rumeso_01328 [Rubellimicrobium mesophilum DSM 19309]
MLTLADFAGTWRLHRTIEDHLGPPGRFEGVASLRPEGDGLRYREDGVLRLGDGPAMAAHRDYLWHHAGDLIEVRFPDGRPFHAFRPEGCAPGTDHPCGLDLYRVTYDVTAWPAWGTEWVVTGPAKDYRMRSAYRRA